MLLGVQDPDSTCSRLNPALLFISKAQDMKAHVMSYQEVRSWSHATWVINYETLTKTLCESITENRREGKKTTRKDLAKLFELHTNAEKERYIQRFALISNVNLVLNVL